VYKDTAQDKKATTTKATRI